MPLPSRSGPPLRRDPRDLWRRGLWLALGLLVGGVVSHVGYWYLPRFRPVSADQSRLLRDLAPGEVRLWVPYPHQNLAALSGLLEEPVEVLGALLRLAGADPRPRGVGALEESSPFDSWGIPPASELVVSIARNPDGRSARGEIAMRPYPLVRWTAKAAGRLADNPWLKGGSPDRDLRIEWRGAAWWLTRGPSNPSTGTPEGHEVGRSSRLLTRIELAETRAGLPAGAWDLNLAGGGLRLASTAAEAPSFAELPSLPWREDAGRSEELALGHLDAQGRLLLIFEGQVGSGELPSVAVFARTRDAAFDGLPGARIVSGLGDPPAATGDYGVLLASDRRGLAMALEIQSDWGPWLQRARENGEAGFVIQLGKAEGLIGDLADLLEDVPFVSPREARRWRDVETVLHGLGQFRWVYGGWNSQCGELRIE